MARVNLSPHCYGVKDAATGKKINGKPGGTITVSDETAKRITRSSNGQLGIISGGESLAIGTKTGRRCTACGFLAQAWSESCPRCGGVTEKE
jgi:hypothetical protein